MAAVRGTDVSATCDRETVSRNVDQLDWNLEATRLKSNEQGGSVVQEWDTLVNGYQYAIGQEDLSPENSDGRGITQSRCETEQAD